MPNKELLEKICRLIRYDILTSTSVAGSGHPTSSLSAVELMASLFFAGFLHYDINNPKNLTNDRIIFSKGHASPLLYSLYHAAGAISYDELLTLRKFGSRLEGHPTPRFPFVDVATGSLGQGLSIGVGMALGIKLKAGSQLSAISDQLQTEKLTTEYRLPTVFVLMGDSESDEGQIWEAIESAAYYKLDNLIGILDVNRLGQFGGTEEGWHLDRYAKKVQAFGWEPIVLKDGHDLTEIINTFTKISNNETKEKPKIIIAKTIKGKGISFLENKEEWHGKVLNKVELGDALKELGNLDLKVRGKISKPDSRIENINFKSNPDKKINNLISKLEKFIPNASKGSEISTRQAYGEVLAEIGEEYSNLVVLDAGVANSTYEDKFQKKFRNRFFEMFIAEENMAGVALGLSTLGFLPFFSTFAAFLTQTFDQLRMAQYSNANLKIVGSHVGVSIGQDGPSQMGLEDLAMMRSILKSTVFYPADSNSAKKLIKIMAENQGLFYLRVTRGKTKILYAESEVFKIGGSKIHKIDSKISNKKSKIMILSAGITLHEALIAQKKLADEGFNVVVIDCYSIKPLDSESIIEYLKEYKNVIVVEDHYPYGGLGEAVSSLILGCEMNERINFAHLCVRKIPRSGMPEELLSFAEIDARSIFKKATDIVK